MRKLFAMLLVLCLMIHCAAFAGAKGQAVILFTNDVHCGIDDDIGYAGLSAFAKGLEASGQDVVLVDAGDAVQGAAVGTLSDGAYLIDLMNATGYDVAVPGNHEFDYGMEVFQSLVARADFPYVSANFIDLRTETAVLPAYVIKEAGGLKIAFVGLTTPKSIITSSPASFQDGEGNFIYGFLRDEDGSAVYAAAQTAAEAARAEGADYVILVAHLGIEASDSPWTSSEVIANTTGFDALIDGHSHSVVSEKVLNKDGQPVLHMQTGTKLENIGMITIRDGAIEGALISSYTGVDSEVGDLVAKIKAELDSKLLEVVAHTEVDLITYDPQAKDTEGNPIRLIRNSETNMGDLCSDAYRILTGADVGFVNGGGIRADIPAGDINYGQVIAVHPYGNMLTVVEATGQQILDCLEWGVRALPGELGGFQQVSGLTFEIHTYIESSTAEDENGMFAGVEGEYRVKNVLVGGEPLDLEKTYTVASHDYMIKQGGDGFTMFQECNLLQDAVMLDNQVLITYIRDHLNGSVGAEYAELYGQGRMTFVTEAP